MRILCPCISISEDDKHSILKHYKNKFEYLGIDYPDKAILNIRADLWFPANAEINGTVRYYLKGETEPITVSNTFVERPYPNKNIASISKRFGRRKAKKGIPLVFDSVDELFRIEHIEVIWDIKDFGEKVVADYPVSFEEPQQDCIYSLWTYEKTVLSIGGKKSDLTVVDNRLESNSNMSVYDDFYFIALNNDSVVTIEELHKPDSNFRIDFETFENLPISIVNTILHKNIEKSISGDDSPEAIYFYHAELLLNDYTA